jgi:hypothetical protein
MEQALLQLLPLALAAALSSVPITATTFILLSSGRGRSGLAFLSGTVLGTLAAVSMATVVSQALPGRSRGHDALVGKLEVLIGLAIVLLGIYTLARRNRGAGGSGPGWMDGIGSFGVVPVFGLGLAMSVRPKSVLLVAAAGLAIDGAKLAFEGNLVAVLSYTAVATSTVVVPVMATILFPRRTEPLLVRMKEWLGAHSTAIGGAMMLMVGGFMIGLGLGLTG